MSVSRKRRSAAALLKGSGLVNERGGDIAITLRLKLRATATVRRKFDSLFTLTAPAKKP